MRQDPPGLQGVRVIWSQNTRLLSENRQKQSGGFAPVARLAECDSSGPPLPEDGLGGGRESPVAGKREQVCCRGAAFLRLGQAQISGGDRMVAVKCGPG
jgi:hypothetical protein